MEGITKVEGAGPACSASSAMSLPSGPTPGRYEFGQKNAGRGSRELTADWQIAVEESDWEVDIAEE